jgi:hypothetical protein
MICWTGTYPFLRDQPKFGQVALIPWPDRPGGSSHAFACSAGACDAEIHKFKKLQREYWAMSTALGLIVNYGIDPSVVHRALWPLKEYHDALPPDTTPPKD